VQQPVLPAATLFAKQNNKTATGAVRGIVAQFPELCGNGRKLFKNF
jgi:hypothetical protein